jgi:hypothetical protein
MSRFHSSPTRWLLAAWAASRLAMLVLGAVHGMAEQAAPFGDVVHYEGWARAAAHDGVPPWHQDGWAYPVGALPVLLLPGLAGWHSAYLVGFVLEMMAFDVLALAGLLVLSRRPGGDLGGAWLWVLALPALGPLALGRFDVVPASLTVCALVLLASRPKSAGALLAMATFVKLWPGLLIAALWRHSRFVTSAIVSIFVALVVAAPIVGWGGLTAVFAFQQHRGLQHESLAALPFMTLRAVGVSGYDVVWDHGAYQVVGPGTTAAGAVCTASLVLSTCLVAVLARRHPAREQIIALLAAFVTLIVLVDKVLSPQYLIWIAAPLAVWAATTGTRRGQVALTFLAACVITQIVATFGYRGLRDGEWPPIVGLAVRDVLLLLVAGILLRPIVSSRSADRAELPQPIGQLPLPRTRRSLESDAVRSAHRTLLIHGAVVLLACTLVAQTVYWPWTDWHIFQAAADRGLDAYVVPAHADVPLTGPLTLGLAGVLNGQLATFLAILILPVIAIRERVPLRYSLAAAPVWAVLAASQHLDDAAAVGLLLESRHHSGLRRGMLIGLAIAFKPWAVLGIPLLWLDWSAIGAAAAVQIVWLPFLPDVLSLSGTTVPVQGNTPLRLFANYHADPADWWRMASLLAVVAAVAWCLKQGQWDAAILVGVIARLATDPGDFAYYWGSAALAALVLVRARGAVLGLIYAAVVVSLIHAKGIPGAAFTTAVLIALFAIATGVLVRRTATESGRLAPALATGASRLRRRALLKHRLEPRQRALPGPFGRHPDATSLPHRGGYIVVSEQSD